MAKGLLALTILALGALIPVALVQAGERSGEQIVKAQCAACHQTGVNGAPKIDDRAAWAPRMKLGLDATVRSAIKGHGAMPARGGMADVTDTELRAAILYMFYPVGASAKAAAAPAPSPARSPNHRNLDGIDIYLGIAPADTKGSYHVNISLRDAATQADIKDAVVEARVANALSGTTKKLAAATFNNALSYGNDFRMTGKEPYAITVEIRRPKASRPIEAKFEFKP
jgi:cytochrome c5